MVDSTFVFEEGKAIEVGNHGEHNFVYADGNEVLDQGVSTVVFEAGTGLGGGVIDDFERGNLNPYTFTGGNWTATTSSPVKSGQYALHSSSNNTAIKSLPGDGLPYYPQRGDIIQVWQYIGNEASGLEMYFGAQDYNLSGNGYSVGLTGAFEVPEERFFIRTDLGGGVSNQVETDGLFAFGTWHLIEIEWDDPTITCRLYKGGGDTADATVSIDDTNYSSGGVGFTDVQGTTGETLFVAADHAVKIGTV